MLNPRKTKPPNQKVTDHLVILQDDPRCGNHIGCSYPKMLAVFALTVLQQCLAAYNSINRDATCSSLLDHCPVDIARVAFCMTAPNWTALATNPELASTGCCPSAKATNANS